MRKRLVAFTAILAILTSCFGSVNVCANIADNVMESNSSGNIVTPFFVAIIITSNSLTASSSGKLTCVGSTDVQPAYKAGVKIELQKSDGGWGTIKTWDETSTSDHLRLSKDWNVDTGTYRLKLTHTAKNSNGSIKESTIDYSSTVSVK